MQYSIIRIGWRNLGRNTRRTANALVMIAIGQFVLLSFASMMNGWKDEIVGAITGPMVGDIQVNVPEWRTKQAVELTITDTSRVVADLRADPAVEQVFPRVYTPALVAPAEQAHVALLLGVDPEAERGERGILAGFTGTVGDRNVFFGRVAAERMGVAVGDEIALVGQDADGSIANGLYTVGAIGVTRNDALNRMGVVMSLADAQDFLVLDDQAHQIVVHARSKEQVEALAQRVSVVGGLAECEVKTWSQVVPQAVKMIGMIDYMLLFVLFFVFIAAVAGIANTMLMATYERKHEIGMLLALGTTPGRIVRIVLVEAALLGVAGAAIGTALGAVAVWISSHTGIDFAALGGESSGNFAIEGMRLPLFVYPWLKLSDVIIGVVSVITMSMLCALWPALVAARLEPMEALRD